ncbi:MAG: hypothetical protein [Bacteriophage sp.]|nr:MAG: hypothetical protein [Bacteriophage sp.]
MIIVKATKRRYKTCAIGCIGSGDTEVFSLARRILDERIARWRQRTADRKGGSLSHRAGEASADARGLPRPALCAGELLASWMPNNGLPVCAMA